MNKYSLINCSLAHFYLVQVSGGCDLKEQSSEKFSRFSQKHYKAIIMRKLTNDPRVLSHLEHHQSTKDTCLMDRKPGPRVPDLMMFTMQGLAFFYYSYFGLLLSLWKISSAMDLIDFPTRAKFFPTEAATRPALRMNLDSPSPIINDAPVILQ